jgi:hypothetical protein
MVIVLAIRHPGDKQVIGFAFKAADMVNSRIILTNQA